MKMILIISVLFLISCDVKTSSEKANDFADSMKIESLAAKSVDSVMSNIMHDVIFDTVGLSSSPVKIISSKLIDKEYSNLRDIKLVYKNISQKKIAGIKFRWYGTDVFGEPADMGSALAKGLGGGFTDNLLGIGKTSSGEWNILSRDAKKIVAAWACEVVFADQSKWKCGNLKK